MKEALSPFSIIHSRSLLHDFSGTVERPVHNKYYDKPVSAILSWQMRICEVLSLCLLNYSVFLRKWEK